VGWEFTVTNLTTIGAAVFGFGASCAIVVYKLQRVIDNLERLTAIVAADYHRINKLELSLDDLKLGV
jgi:hypothetical protein